MRREPSFPTSKRIAPLTDFRCDLFSCTLFFILHLPHFFFSWASLRDWEICSNAPLSIQIGISRTWRLHYRILAAYWPARSELKTYPKHICFPFLFPSSSHVGEEESREERTKIGTNPASKQIRAPRRGLLQMGPPAQPGRRRPPVAGPGEPVPSCPWRRRAPRGRRRLEALAPAVDSVGGRVRCPDGQGRAEEDR